MNASRLRLLQKVRAAAKKKILILPHAAAQMSRPDRMITPEEVHKVLLTGSIIEDYPEDPKGHSCLVLGFSESAFRHLHVVCVPREDFLAVVTAYVPTPGQWSSDFRKRK